MLASSDLDYLKSVARWDIYCLDLDRGLMGKQKTSHMKRVTFENMNH